MEKNLVYEGKAKRIYTIAGRENIYLQEFKDDATAFNGEKKDSISGKGILNNTISSIIFEYLKSQGIESHFIEKISDNEMLVTAVEIIKVEVVCRNIAAGSLVKKFGFKEGEKLSSPLIEYYYKSDALGDPLFSITHIEEMKLATSEQMKIIDEMTLQINKLLIEFFRSHGIKLVDFKLEFGTNAEDKIILADEISPDTCRLWDSETNRKLDKDNFRFGLGDIAETYKEILDKIKK